MRKLICIDVDGTLIHGEYKITDDIKQALDNCSADKVIVSGRTVEELLKLNSGFDLIGTNGGEIYRNGQFEREFSISTSEAALIIKEVSNFGHFIVAHTPEGPYIQADSSEQVKPEVAKILGKYDLSDTDYNNRVESMYQHIYGRCHKVDNLCEYIVENNIYINKLESHFEGDKTKLINLLTSNYSVESFSSLESNIEIVPKGALKSVAINEYVNGRDYQVIGIGDGDNDIQMFEVSDYTIAMGNGTNNLKALANTIVSSGEPGFIEALSIAEKL